MFIDGPMPVSKFQPSIKKFYLNKSFGFFAFLTIVLISTFVYEYIVESRISTGWTSILQHEVNNLSEYFQSKYKTYQSVTLERVKKISSESRLVSALKNNADSSKLLFYDFLNSFATKELSFELFDNKKHSLSWAQTFGPEIDTSLLTDQKCSFVIQRPIYTFLIISVPIKSDNSIVGYLVGKQIFDVNYPINNRFINTDAFYYTFTSRLNVVPEFIFANDTLHRIDSTKFAVPLLSINNKIIGYALYSKPTQNDYKIQLNENLSAIRIIVYFLILIIILSIFIRYVNINSRRSKYIYITLCIWIVRYVMIWFGLPNKIVRIEIFDPAYFASQFGFGLAKSLGDLFLSSVFLFVNILLIVHNYEFYDKKVIKEIVTYRDKFIRIVFIGLLGMFVLLLLRAFGATVVSSVYDSSLDYHDYTEVLPSIEVSIMLISLLLFTFSIVMMITMMIISMIKSVRLILRSQSSDIALFAIVLTIIFIGSIIFGLSQENAVLTGWQRVSMLMIIYFFSLWTYIKHRGGRKIHFGKLISISLIISIMFIVYFLDLKTNDSERSHIESFADDISKPVDNWLTFLVNNTLDDFSNQDVKDIIISGDEYDIATLAFSKWANSILSKEGNNCSIAIINPQNEILSEFHIGTNPFNSSKYGSSDLPDKRTVINEERYQSGILTRWCEGYAPILSSTGEKIATTFVEITGNKQTFLRGETPEILRGYQSDKFRSIKSGFVLSEYFNGKLINSTSETFPRNKSLNIEQEYRNQGRFWEQDTIDGKIYNSYYFKDKKVSEAGSWFVLSVEAKSIMLHLYAAIQYIIFYSLLLGIILLIGIIILYLQGKRFEFRFAEKLSIAFMVVSLIPVLILAYSNRQYATERANELSIKKLDEQTSIVSKELQRRYKVNVPASLTQLTDSICIGVANDLNIDFNVYFKSSIYATSKPEIFEAELMDQKLTAGAFSNLFLKGKEYFTESGLIGNLSYMVGYRPLFAEDGSVIGAISIPTLYQLSDADEELSNRNMYLYNAYALALLLSLLSGLFFTKQLSSPIRRLTNAIKQISKGDLDVHLNNVSNDELGELESAFKKMTIDLKITQEQMLKAQREAAWKEMAKQVAHEIKNPLTPVKLSIQHLRQAYHDKIVNFEEILNRVTNTVLEQIESLSKIASEFSNFGRMPERKYEKVDVHQVVRDVMNLFGEHRDIKYQLKLNASEHYTKADKEEFQRGIINIIRNSIQSLKENGIIIVETKNSDNMLEITIQDNGMGMTDDVKQHLFELNFSTKTEGMGIGLAMVKKMVDDLSGMIHVESKINIGTTVTITLPIFK